MKPSLAHSSALIALTTVLVASSSASPASSSSFPVTQARPFSQSSPVEGRSLLDLLIGGLGEGNSINPLKGSSMPLLDLAQTLLGKGDGLNSKLYMKVFKLIFNLFMDVMADRSDEAKRREDISPVLSLLRSKFILNNSPAYERQVESILKRQKMYKPYFVE